MKTITKNFILLLSLFFIAVSSSKDDGNNGFGGNSGSRAVKYEITGNFSGKVLVIYTDAGGGMANEESTSFPKTKEFTAASNVTGVGIGASSTVANPGQPGQTLIFTS